MMNSAMQQEPKKELSPDERRAELLGASYDKEAYDMTYNNPPKDNLQQGQVKDYKKQYICWVVFALLLVTPAARYIGSEFSRIQIGSEFEQAQAAYATGQRGRSIPENASGNSPIGGQNAITIIVETMRGAAPIITHRRLF